MNETSAPVYVQFLLQIALPAFVSAFTAGLFLLGGYFYRRRLDAEEAAGHVWRAICEPVVDAADDLVARLFEMLLRRRTLDFTHPITHMTAALSDTPREISTVWRLARFLATRAYLDRNSASSTLQPTLGLLEYYAVNKARMAMKGNIFRAPHGVQTETQQVIGAKLLSLSQTNEVKDLDFFLFLSSLKPDPELEAVADACREYLDFAVSADTPSPQMLAVCHLAVYLIDLVHDLRPASKWEEFRLFLIALLRAWNHSSTGRAVFLYRPGDLETSSYLDTFNNPRDRNRRYLKRARRRSRRNTGRRVTKEGIGRTIGRSPVFLPYGAAPGDLRLQLQAAFPSTAD